MQCKSSKVIFLYCLFLPTISLFAQEADSLSNYNLYKLHSKIDSLNDKVQFLESELQKIQKNENDDRTEFDSLIAILNVDSVETRNVEQRSRYKRVDALLTAIAKRPGQLRFSGGATATLHSGSNIKSRNASAVGSFDFFALTSFSSNSLLFFDLEAVGGNGPNDFYKTFTGLNDDAGSTQDQDGTDRLTVLEAWTEFTLLNEIFTITAGKIDLTNYFDNNVSANDETMQFISSVFVNSAAFAVPGNAPGFRARTTLFNQFHFQVGFSSTENSGKDIFKSIFKIGSINFVFAPGTGFESNFRFYGYIHPDAENSKGWGLSADKVLFDAYNIFARFGTNQSKLADFWGIESAWSVGTRFVTRIAGQLTVLGIAFGRNKPGIKQLNEEEILEIYSRYKLNDWINFSPHLQFVNNAAGTSNNFTILSFRTNFSF